MGCELLGPSARCIVERNPFAYISILTHLLTCTIGCPQIVFHKQTSLYIPEQSALQYKLIISGKVNFPSHLHADGNTEMIGSVAQPHAMSLFPRKHRFSLFYSQEVSGYNHGYKRLEALAARISDCADNFVCIACIERLLLAQIVDNISGDACKLQIEYVVIRVK